MFFCTLAPELGGSGAAREEFQGGGGDALRAPSPPLRGPSPRRGEGEGCFAFSRLREKVPAGRMRVTASQGRAPLLLHIAPLRRVHPHAAGVEAAVEGFEIAAFPLRGHAFARGFRLGQQHVGGDAVGLHLAEAGARRQRGPDLTRGAAVPRAAAGFIHAHVGAAAIEPVDGADAGLGAAAGERRAAGQRLGAALLAGREAGPRRDRTIGLARGRPEGAHDCSVY